jgi:hypothetical protein
VRREVSGSRQLVDDPVRGTFGDPDPLADLAHMGQMASPRQRRKAISAGTSVAMWPGLAVMAVMAVMASAGSSDSTIARCT